MSANPAEAADTQPKSQYEDPNRPWSPDELNQPLTADETELIQGQLPLLNEVIQWFDERIADYSSPEIISGVNISSKPEDVKNSVLFAQSMIKDYKYKRKDFVERFRKNIDALKSQE
jgi:hypothetical protein